jgi:hypothetical protein
MVNPMPNPMLLNLRILDQIHSLESSKVEILVRIENSLEGLIWTYMGHEVSDRDAADLPWGNPKPYYIPIIRPPLRAIIETGIRREFIDHILHLKERPLVLASAPRAPQSPHVEDASAQS